MLMCVKFTELPVSDQDRAVNFYTGKLGLKVVQDARYKEGWRWIELEIPGARTRILLTEQQPGHSRDAPRLVLVASNVEETYRALLAKGVAFATEPTQAPWNQEETFAMFRDPEGNMIVIGSA